LVVEVVEDDPRFDSAGAALDVDIKDRPAVHGPVDDHCRVRALPSKAGAAAPRQQGHTERPTHADGSNDVVDRTRHDDRDRHLPVVRRVGGVRRAVARVDVHLTLDGLSKGLFDRCGDEGLS
jgi:hypothetical protein